MQNEEKDMEVLFFLQLLHRDNNIRLELGGGSYYYESLLKINREDIFKKYVTDVLDIMNSVNPIIAKRSEEFINQFNETVTEQIN